MYISDIGTKEINQYYAQHGGRRSPRIKNFANYIENAKAGRISTTDTLYAARTNTATAANRSSAAAKTATTQTASRSSLRSNTATENVQDQTKEPSAATADSQKACCDKCRLTNELMLKMFSNNLYTQSGLGFSAAGSGALAAYQSLSKFFGNGVFS